MHDKTLIHQIVDELEKLINQNAEIELQIGNFTNLNEKTILKYLNNLKPDIFDLETLKTIKISKNKGNIKCYNCEYFGSHYKIIEDHDLHLAPMVMCLVCESLQTKKVGGNEIKVIPLSRN